MPRGGGRGRHRRLMSTQSALHSAANSFDIAQLENLEKLDLRTLGPVAAAALAHKPLEGRRNLDIRTDIRSLVIEADPPIPYQVDGDHLGASKRLRFAWTPNHLALLMPLNAKG